MKLWVGNRNAVPERFLPHANDNAVHFNENAHSAYPAFEREKQSGIG
jgi:hypothetical protein